MNAYHALVPRQEQVVPDAHADREPLEKFAGPDIAVKVRVVLAQLVEQVTEGKVGGRPDKSGSPR